MGRVIFRRFFGGKKAAEKTAAQGVKNRKNISLGSLNLLCIINHSTQILNARLGLFFYYFFANARDKNDLQKQAVKTLTGCFLYDIICLMKSGSSFWLK